MRLVRMFVVAAAWLVFTAACTHTIPLRGTLDARPASPPPVPIAVGVYYPPEFRAYKHEQSRMGTTGSSRWARPA